MRFSFCVSGNSWEVWQGDELGTLLPGEEVLEMQIPVFGNYEAIVMFATGLKGENFFVDLDAGAIIGIIDGEVKDIIMRSTVEAQNLEINWKVQVPVAV